MATVNIELGGMLAPPPRFEPTEQFADRLYLYRIDRKRGICKLTILNDAATRPAGYYAIKTPVVPQPVVSAHPDQTEILAEVSEPAIEPPRPRQELRLPSFRLPRVRLPKIKLPKRTIRHTKPAYRSGRPSRRGVHKSIVAAASTVATAAAFVVVYPMYPQISYSVGQTIAPPATVNAIAESPVSAGNELRIPKIGVRTAVLESDSLEILNKKEGVWHQSGTLGVDNFVLAGHRWKYLPPNTSTFYHLSKLAEGDTIVIDWFGKRYLYTVKQVLTVHEERTDLIQPTPKPRLTIYTCNDKAETERIVVIAEPEQ